MAAPKAPRKGSLQFWPRKRASKLLPSVNWDAIKVNSSKGLKGFIGYKVGMASAFAKDNTEHSMTKGKKISVPVTILECPSMKVFSIRFYKNGTVANEVLADNVDKEMKSVIKLPKKKHGKIDDVKDFDDIRIVAYSQVKKTNIKKTPDVIEIGLSGSLEEKINYAKDKLNKEISISEVFEKGQVADARGLTKGKGLSGAVSRFGITLKQHKSEKGRRKPGSLGPWHPARVTFRVPMAGQLGMFTRVVYNNKIIKVGKAGDDENLKGITNFGDVKTDYLIIRGSIQGPQKRQILLTYPLRETKKQVKKNFEFMELR
ncbi:50S ribosomal protein L3 [Candidatus Pacearchaeota archaeon RBG_16_35_8]|nr:50S ribosomal protein L3P [uncultured archaeon]AJS13194.1 large subunit ribosomal protein L3 [uncultured archaeon]OGJ12328.1 MAG: 50S ribosomal protein L3 [Candidatus Pacearchaeota archaeon RBG_16_35_8]